MALPVDTGDDDARSGRSYAGSSSENQRTGDQGGDQCAGNSALHFKLLGLYMSTTTAATILHVVDLPWTFRGHSLTLVDLF
jgi:hypothetical protein